MSSCFSMGRYIAQQVAAEQRDAVTRRVRDMFPEINLPPAPAPAPARARARAPAPAPARAPAPAPAPAGSNRAGFPVSCGEGNCSHIKYAAILNMRFPKS